MYTTGQSGPDASTARSFGVYLETEDKWKFDTCCDYLT